MLKEFIKKNKKVFILTICFLGIFIAYLYILFLPGYHHWDGFLFEQKDGSFAGKGYYASYSVNVERSANSATITFMVDDLVHEYLITGTDTGLDVYIYEDSKAVFHGQAISSEDSSYWLMGDEDYMNNDILVLMQNQDPSPEELFPSKNWLYNVAASNHKDTFGTPAYLIAIIILTIYLILDIKYPKLFFYLQHSLAVSGGEPSEWYYTSQLIGRGIVIVIILIFILISLFG